MLEVKATGNRHCTAASNKAIASTISAAFARWMHLNMPLSNCHQRGTYHFAVQYLVMSMWESWPCAWSPAVFLGFFTCSPSTFLRLYPPCWRPVLVSLHCIVISARIGKCYRHSVMRFSEKFHKVGATNRATHGHTFTYRQQQWRSVLIKASNVKPKSWQTVCLILVVLDLVH